MSLGEEVQKISGNLIQSLEKSEVLEKHLFLFNRLKKQNVLLPIKAVTFSVDSDACTIIYKSVDNSLLDLVTKSKLRRLKTEKKVFSIFYRLVRSVSKVHKLDFHHRHLKLENCFIDSKKNVYLADFAYCAPYIPGVRRRYYISSSLHYASPEIYDNTPHVGPEVDVWALGVILYLLLTGYFPFSGSTPDEVRSAITRECHEKTWTPDPDLEVPPTSTYLLSQIFTYDSTKRVTVLELLTTLKKHK